MQPVPATHWYGYQIMISDLASVAVLANSSNRPWAATLGLASLALTPGIIHYVHDNKTYAAASPMYRLVLVLGLGTLGYYLPECENRGHHACGMYEALALGGLGALVSMVIDWTVAREKVHAASPSRRSMKQPTTLLGTAGIVPNASGGASLVLGGRF